MGAPATFTGFFSGELLVLTGGCWPTLLNLWFKGEEFLRTGRPESPLVQFGEVLDILLSFLWEDSKDLISGNLELVPFSVVVLSAELKVLDEEAPGTSEDVTLSVGGWREEDCRDSKVLLEELTDARGRGMELLFGSLLFTGNSELRNGPEEEFVFAVALSFVSSIFVLKGNC